MLPLLDFSSQLKDNEGQGNAGNKKRLHCTSTKAVLSLSREYLRREKQNYVKRPLLCRISIYKIVLAKEEKENHLGWLVDAIGLFISFSKGRCWIGI